MESGLDEWIIRLQLHGGTSRCLLRSSPLFAALQRHSQGGRRGVMRRMCGRNSRRHSPAGCRDHRTPAVGQGRNPAPFQGRWGETYCIVHQPFLHLVSTSERSAASPVWLFQAGIAHGHAHAARATRNGYRSHAASASSRPPRRLAAQCRRQEHVCQACSPAPGQAPRVAPASPCAALLFWPRRPKP
jgi:hypothetical protein